MFLRRIFNLHIIIFGLFFFVGGLAKTHYRYYGKKRIVYTIPKCGVHTLPKSGTYFLISLLHELRISSECVSHSMETLALPDDAQYCVTIRDFRDFWISLRDFMDKVAQYCIETNESWSGIATDKATYIDYLNLSKEQRLISLMTSDAHTPYPYKSINENLRGIEHALKNPGVLCLRFEDYIGARSGESNKRQEEAILALCALLGKRMKRSQIRRACDKVWGTKTTTMNKGTTGRWKEEFNPKVTKIFKERWNQVLLDWGYETEWDWDKNYELPL